MRLDHHLRDEADFANASYAKHADNLAVHDYFFDLYRSPHRLWHWRSMASLMLGDLRNQQLLDLGCGMGEESVYFAKLGARVTGIDISEVGVETLKRRAVHHRLPIRALQMRADPTDLPTASFDRVHGLGILHHVGIDRGLAEVHRLLKPGGIAVFLEPLGNSPGVEAAKRWIMTNARFLGDFEEVTDHEENLRWVDLERATARFSDTCTIPYNLLFRLKRFYPTKAWNFVRKLDFGLLNLAPSLRYFAGGVAIRLRK